MSPKITGELSPITVTATPARTAANTASRTAAAAARTAGGAANGGSLAAAPPLDNPSYKRCHLCVRIFSTKANLSSHIRHVHLGEAKHSRVKSIPCPHCNKMFSRKVINPLINSIVHQFSRRKIS